MASGGKGQVEDLVRTACLVGHPLLWLAPPAPLFISSQGVLGEIEFGMPDLEAPSSWRVGA